MYLTEALVLEVTDTDLKSFMIYFTSQHRSLCHVASEEFLFATPPPLIPKTLTGED